MNGRSQYVAVIGVGELELRNEMGLMQQGVETLETPPGHQGARFWQYEASLKAAVLMDEVLQ